MWISERVVTKSGIQTEHSTCDMRLRVHAVVVFEQVGILCLDYELLQDTDSALDTCAFSALDIAPSSAEA